MREHRRVDGANIAGHRLQARHLQQNTNTGVIKALNTLGMHIHSDGLMQECKTAVSPLLNALEVLQSDCSISNALAMEILQSCVKPSIYILFYMYMTCILFKVNLHATGHFIWMFAPT